MVSDVITTIWWKHAMETVLILVLMEYGLWPKRHCFQTSVRGRVLILVLMEYGLWRIDFGGRPCRHRSCLNPCFDGIWSLTVWPSWSSWQARACVLILVLMEYGLWLLFKQMECADSVYVLILVLMEYGLWLIKRMEEWNMFQSLNPCFDGIWSLTPS